MIKSSILLSLGLASLLATGVSLAGEGHHHDSMNAGHHDAMYKNGHKGEHPEGHSGHHGWGKKDWSPAQRVEKMQKHLKLSDQQAAQLKDIFERTDLQLKPLREQSKSNRELIRAMVDSGSINDTELESLAKAQGDLKAQKIVLRSKSRVEVMQVLNAEQLEKYKAWWNKRKHQGMH